MICRRRASAAGRRRRRTDAVLLQPRQSQDQGNGAGCLAERFLCCSFKCLLMPQKSFKCNSLFPFRPGKSRVVGFIRTLGFAASGTRTHTFAHTLPTAGRRRLWSEEGQAVVLPLRDDVAQGVVVPSLARRRRRPRRSRGPGSSLAP